MAGSKRIVQGVVSAMLLTLLQCLPPYSRAAFADLDENEFYNNFFAGKATLTIENEQENARYLPVSWKNQLQNIIDDFSDDVRKKGQETPSFIVYTKAPSKGVDKRNAGYTLNWDEEKKTWINHAVFQFCVR